MRKVANIVTSAKKNTFGNIFNVVQSCDEAIEGIPTLIIGLESAKENIDNFSILKRQYGDIWWTFKKTEKRCEYEEDIVKFYNYAILREMEKTKYVYVDIVRYPYSKIKKVINFLGDSSKKYVFLTKNSNFMFVYSEKYNTVFGISLELCEYLGVKKNKVYKLLRNREYINDTKFIPQDIRRVVGNNTHYIPPLYACLN